MKKISCIILFIFPVISFAQQNIFRYDESNDPIYAVEPEINSPITRLPVNQLENRANYNLMINGVSNNKAIRSNDGNLSLSLSTSEPIPASAQYQLLLDGAVYVPAQSSPYFSLVNINRGEHTVVGQILENGQVIQNSAPVTFFLERISIHSPARVKPQLFK